MRRYRKAIPAVLVALILGFWVSVVPALRAGRVEARDLTLPERIFARAAEAESALKERPFEERAPELYPRVIDLYRQVATSSAPSDLRDRAHVRMADLTREMALRSGDATQYGEAIDIYRRLVISHPESPFVGEALVAIANIYEYELQDVDGASAAYREIARRFPDSVSGREAAAAVVRLDPSAGGGDSGTDIIGTVTAPGAELAIVAGPEGATARVLNLRSFAGPDYARVVVDLNRPIEYREQRAGTRVKFTLPGAEISDALLGRRLATARGSLLKGLQIEQLGDGVSITLDLGTLDDASSFMMEDPSRLVIDLRGAPRANAGAAPRPLTTRPERTNVPGAEIAGIAPAPAPLPDVAAPPAPAAPKIDDRPARQIRSIVIDPGHGGHDTGTIGPGGLAEKDVALDIARRLRASLRAELPGVEIVLTRDSDRFVSLEERTAIANARDADLFISIHANASQSSQASGIETFVLDPNAVKDAGAATPEAGDAPSPKRVSQAYATVGFGSQIAESRSLAGFVQGSLVRGISAKSPRSARDRGIKHASFVVLRGARMPSILAEVSFVSNPDDENRLRTPGFRQKIASSLTAGIRSYVRAVGAR